MREHKPTTRDAPWSNKPPMRTVALATRITSDVLLHDEKKDFLFRASLRGTGGEKEKAV